MTGSPFPEHVFVIAELSANHGQRLENAIAAVRSVKETGADAIKIQTYTPDTITLDCDNEHFQIKQGTIWDGTTLHKLYQEAYTPWEWHKAIKDEAERLGLIFFSTPFDCTSVDFLEALDVPLYKIASFEINDIPLIEYAASKGKPMIMSIGVATPSEIHDAIAACHRVGNHDITLLKCTSAYPASLADANLRTIPDIAKTFQVKTGLSDHTLGSVAAVGAVALGGCVIEKHFIQDRSIGGPDASFSMLPDDFKEMVRQIRQMELAMGRVDYMEEGKAPSGAHFKRSLFVAADVIAGESFTVVNVRSVRPNVGLAPKYLADVLGRKARCHIKAGTPFSWDLCDPY